MPSIGFAIDGYDWLITCDKNMPFQQNLSGKPLAVMVLPTSQIRRLEPIFGALRDALRAPTPGHFVLIDNDGKRLLDPLPHLIGRSRRRN